MAGMQASVVFLLCLAVSTSESSPCNLQKGNGKCKCSKEPEHQNQILLSCNDITTGDLQNVFDELLPWRESYYELSISNSDLAELDMFPKQIKNLKLVYVKGLTTDRLQHLLRPLNDLQELVIDGATKIDTLTSQLLGEKLQLGRLSLNRNDIQDVDEKAFEYITNLNYLSLENNNLKSVPNAALNIHNVHLKLNGNPIKHVNDEATSKIIEGSIKITLDSLECSCDTKDLTFVKYVREQNLDTIRCHSNEYPEGEILKDMSKGRFCPGDGAAVISSSFSLLIMLFTLLMQI